MSAAPYRPAAEKGLGPRRRRTPSRASPPSPGAAAVPTSFAAAQAWCVGPPARLPKPELGPPVRNAGVGETAVEALRAPSGGTTACGIMGEAAGRLSCRACERGLPPPPPLLSVRSDAAELRALSACFSATSGVDAPCRPLTAPPCS